MRADEQIDAPSPSTEQRMAVRSELEAARAAFHVLLARVPDESWRQASGNERWTIGQELWHVADALYFVRGMIEKARRGRGSLPFKLPRGLADLLRALYVRWNGRRATRQLVAEIYDGNHAMLIATLASLREDDTGKASTALDLRLTVEELLRLPATHLAEHTANVQRGLEAGR